VAKGGTPSSRVGAGMKRAGDAAGIDFTGLTDRAPNSILMHAIIHMLQCESELTYKDVTAYHESVFEAYFTLGIFPDKNALLELAKNNGLVYDKIHNLYNDTDQLKELEQTVVKEARNASKSGITGVPFFTFNGDPHFSGAQPVAKFAQVLQEYAE
jgi:predicted DsbA family dithiol-disulfide isomerase